MPPIDSVLHIRVVIATIRNVHWIGNVAAVQSTLREGVLASICGISTLFHFWLHISDTFIQIKSCQHADMYLCCMLQLYPQKFGSLVGFGTNPLIPTYKTGELKWMPHIYADVDILQGSLLLWLVCSPPKIGNMDPFPISHHNCDRFAALQGIGNMDPFPLEDSTRDTDVSIWLFVCNLSKK